MLARYRVRLFSTTVLRAAGPVRSNIAKRPSFPGSLGSKFTQEMSFSDPLKTDPFDTYRLVDLDGTQLDPSYELPISDEKVVQIYRDMLTVSILDPIMYDAQRQGRLSFYMVSAGEEGIAVGSAAALTDEDVMFCQYREQGAILHRGVTLKQMMAQLFSNADDEGNGQNMPVHYQSKTLNIHPISSPLTSQLPHAAGAAYALKLHGKKAVAICYFGEGAASEGDFHAALNIAATRSCPVIYLCRNNGYAISTPTSDQYRGDGIVSRGAGYGIPTIRVDGNDALAVYRATKEAREIAISQSRPVLIEAMSYRVAHHSTSDDSFAYRSRGEVEDWKRDDSPVTRLRQWLELRGLWSEEQEAATRAAVKKEILKEFNAAEKVPKPEITHLFSDVFEEVPATLKEQKDELKQILDTYPENYNLSAHKGIGL